MPFRRAAARIGTLFFKYEDPDVSVSTEARTVEQEALDDEIVVQRLGRRPDEITIDAVVSEEESYIVDDLTSLGRLLLRTERWQGFVVVTSTDTSYMRAIDGDGEWLHEATINCLEVSEMSPTGGGSIPGEGQPVRGTIQTL